MTQIVIDSRRETKFEFDVAIHGLKESAAKVRFIIENSRGYEFALTCTKLNEKKWQVVIPPLDHLQEQNKFRVEVIADGYYFCPAAGQVRLKAAPLVSVASFLDQKPSVETSLPTKLKEAFEIAQADKAKLIAECGRSGIAFTKVGRVLKAMNEAKMINPEKVSKMMDLIQNYIGSINTIIR